MIRSTGSDTVRRTGGEGDGGAAETAEGKQRLRAMGAMLSNAFIPPDSILGCDEDGCMAPFSSGDWAWGLVQVLSLMMVYAYILFTASNMLSDGSELLLLVPSIAGIVGSVVLPILGAVPDGAILGGKSGHTTPHA